MFRMTLRPLLSAIVMAIAMLTATLTAPDATARPAAKPANRTAPHVINWSAMVARSADDGYVMGNPEAPLHLIAYLSYTCPHCADFEKESFVQLSVGMIMPGKGSYEVRPFLRNGLDLAVSLLAECGPPSKFFGNTQLLLATQREWMAPLGSLTEAQKARWDNPDFGTKMRAVASDLGLYTIMARRGYERVTLDRCLANKATADRLAQHTNDAAAKEWVKGTPAFLIDGVPLIETYSWETLKPQIEARLH